MVRTVITLDEEEKKWLDCYSQTHRQSLAKTVRLAIQQFHKRQQKGHDRQVLEKAYGMWDGQNGDAVDYVRKIRSEWER